MIRTLRAAIAIAAQLTDLPRRSRDMHRVLLSGLALLLVTSVASAVPGSFNLIQPTNTSEDVDVWPVFEWGVAADPGDVTYTLQISTTPQFTPGTYTEYSGLTVTQFRPEVDLIMDRLYYWKVKAVNDHGEETWSSAPGSPFGHWVLQTIPPSVPRQILGSVPLQANRTLIPENTPYTWRQGNLVIPQGIWLEARAGVEIQVELSYHMQIHGEIHFLGDETNPVSITSGRPVQAPGDWKHILFASDVTPAQISTEGEYLGGTIMRHVVLKHAGSNLYAVQVEGGPVYLEGLVIDQTNSSPGGVRVLADDTVVRGCAISGLTSAHHGIGIHANANGVRLIENNISDCRSVLLSGGGSNEIRRGGGVLAQGTGLKILRNTISGCEAYIYTTTSSQNSTYAQGGGFYSQTAYSVIESNEIVGCQAYARKLGSVPSYTYAEGGGVYLAGQGNVFRDNTIAQNSVGSVSIGNGNWYSYGGGLYIHSSANDCIIDYCTITNNVSSQHGGGIYGGKTVINSNVRYNVSEAALGGGLYGSYDQVRYNNISNNEGFNLYAGSAADIDATHNWWMTRSDQVQIENGIWDSSDTEGALGVVTYQPYLYDVSETAPGYFTEVQSIVAYSDDTYTNPLNTTVQPGDTLYFRITGVDANAYNRDVTVVEVINYHQFAFISPFFEETGDNTGVFDCRVYLSDSTLLPDQIVATPGDSLTFRSVVAPDHWFHVVIGQSVAPTADFTFADLDYTAPAEVAFTNSSTGSITSVVWDFGDGSEPSTELNPTHTFETGGLFQVTLQVNGPSGVDAITKTVRVLGAAPLLHAVTDVPQDQGGWVFVDFYRSLHDTDPLQLAEIYTVERLDPAGWTAVGHSSAYAELSYRVQVPTLCDSTAYDPCETSFRVIASMDEGTFASEIMIGWSTDDLAPGVPQGFAVGCSGDLATLNWTGVDDPDFQYYRVYQGEVEDFNIADAVAVFATAATMLNVEAGCGIYYRVAAVDFAGNESQPTDALYASTISSVQQLPGRITLTGNYPNPFNPQTTIQFSLPSPSFTTLAIHDLTGRRVATLLAEELPAGHHEAIWNGRDAHGRHVASGIYFARLIVRGEVLTGRMTLIK